MSLRPRGPIGGTLLHGIEAGAGKISKMTEVKDLELNYTQGIMLEW